MRKCYRRVITYPIALAISIRWQAQRMAAAVERHFAVARRLGVKGAQ